MYHKLNINGFFLNHIFWSFLQLTRSSLLAKRQYGIAHILPLFPEGISRNGHQ